MNIFQTFYQLNGRLPLSNGLLVIPDGDPPPGEDRVNMKSLYEMFQHTNSHGLVSLPFLGTLQYYLEKNDFSLIKDSLTELCSNLSYKILSEARDFDFNAVSDLIAKISYLLKTATKSNIKDSEESYYQNTIPTEGIIDDLFNDDNLTDDDTDYKKVTLESDSEDITDSGKLLDVSDEETEEIIAEPAIPEVPLSDNLTVSLDTGPKQIRKYITTNLNIAVLAANKIKNKYRRKIVGNKENRKDNDDDDKNKKNIY